MKFGTFIKTLANNAGIKDDNAKLIELLSVDVEVPDEIATAVTNNLMTLETAKHNNDVAKHFKALALNGADSKVSELATKFGLSPGVIQSINDETNTFEKIGKLTEAIQAAEAAKGKGKGGENKEATEALKKEVESLNNQIVQIKESHKGEIETLNNTHSSALTDIEINSLLASKPYAGDFDNDVNVTIARTFIDKALGSKNAILVRKEDGSLALMQKDNPSLEYREANKALTLNELVDSTLAANKLLKVTDPTGGPGTGNNPINSPEGGEPVEGETSFYDKQLETLTE